MRKEERVGEWRVESMRRVREAATRRAGAAHAGPHTRIRRDIFSDACRAHDAAPGVRDASGVGGGAGRCKRGGEVLPRRALVWMPDGALIFIFSKFCCNRSCTDSAANVFPSARDANVRAAIAATVRRAASAPNRKRIDWGPNFS